MRISATKQHRFSLFGLRVALAFYILALAYRVTLPFGDEPDFTVRALELVEVDFPAWTPYYWLSGWLQHLNVYSNCLITASPTEILAQIDGASCGEGLSQVLGRTLLMILLASPVLLVVAWRGVGLALLRATVNDQSEELNRRIDALGLSLLLPGMIFYLGLLSHEQLTLLISLYVFFFWGNWLIVMGLVALIGSLDLGNAVIVAAFLVIHAVITRVVALLGLKWATFMVVGALASVYVSGVEGLIYVKYLSLLESKADAILQKSLDADFFDKYPLILRPVITFMTGIFMTPSGVKVFPLYMVYGVFLLVMINRLRKSHRARPHLTTILSIITTIMFFSFLLPDYTNAKYYIFLAPFFLYSALIVFSRKWVFVNMFGMAWMVPLGLLTFRAV